MTGEVRVTKHARERYIERVDRRAGHDQAEAVIRKIALGGRARATPRHWMRMVDPSPGARFIYCADHPHVCLMVRDHSVVTVFSKPVCRRWARLAGPQGGRGRGGSGEARGRRRAEPTPFLRAA